MDPHDSRPVVLVGARDGMLRALRKAKQEAVILVDAAAGAPKREVPPWKPVEVHGEFAPIARAAEELLDGREPSAVLAMAERTVLVAARLREHFGLPGNDATVALRCADKVEMKAAMDAHEVPVARWRPIEVTTKSDELIDALGLPIVVKPRRDSGGRLQRVARDTGTLAQVLDSLRRRGELERGFGWMAEHFVVGTEMSVECFVERGALRFWNPTEYYVPRHANICPAVLSADETRDVRAFTERALAAAGVERGVTHLELFRTRDGLVFGELAIRPPGGRLMQVLERAWGFCPWTAMLRLERGESFDFPAAPRRVAGVYVMHPGVGTIASIDGYDAACELPFVRSIKLKVKPGDSVGERIGSGQDIGAIYAEADDRDTVANALSRALETLDVRLR